MAEKSKGLAGNPAPGGEASLLCSDCASPEDVSDLEFLFSAEPAFSSKQHKVYHVCENSIKNLNKVIILVL